MPRESKGILFATLSAFLNSISGIIAKELIIFGYSAISIASLKCAIAFWFLSFFLLFKPFRPKYRISLRYIIHSAICGLCGIFILFYFETKAYTLLKAPIVVFLLIGSSAITTFLLATLFLKERINLNQTFWMGLAVSGMSIIVLNEFDFEPYGVILATTSGIGYGLFLIFSKYFNMKSDVFTLWSTIGFGTLFLHISSPLEIVDLSKLTTQYAILFIALALFPTLGGYFCTTRALEYSNSSKVQLIELSEPVFSIILSAIILSEIIGIKDLIGAILILCSIYFYNIQSNKHFS